MINLSKNILLGIAALSLVMLYGCTEPQSLDFKYKAAQGVSRSYNLTNTESNEGEVNGQVTKQSRTISFNITENVKEITETGDSKVEVVMNDAKMSMTQDGKSQEIPLTQLNGKSVQLKINPRGRILEKDGTEIDPKSEDASSSGLMTVIFPDKPISIGGTWDDSKERTEPINENTKAHASSKTVYTFVGYEALNNVKYAKIEEKTILKQEITTTSKLSPEKPVNSEAPATSEETPAAPPEQPSVNSKAEGETTGYILFDHRNGCIVKIDKKTSINNSLTVSGKDQTGKQQTETMKIKSTASVLYELAPKTESAPAATQTKQEAEKPAPPATPAQQEKPAESK